MNEKMNKALVYFGREDLTDDLYENDIDDNIQVFLTIRQMIELYNLQSKIDKAIEYIEKSMNNPQPFYEYLFGDENGKVENLDKLLDILKENNNEN